MNSFFIYLFEVSVCLTAFYCLYLVVFSNQKYFSLNRLYLVLGLALSFIIPAIVIETSFAPITGYASYFLDEVTLAANQATPLTTSVSWTSIGLIIYLVGVLLATFRFLFHLANVLKVITTAESKEKHGRYWLVKNSNGKMIGSFFNYIFWYSPDNFSGTEEELVLEHEKVHVREWHSADVILVELTSILLWFNPFIYLLKNAIGVNHEFIADKAVAKSNTQNYVNLLATQALSANGMALASSFDSTYIINRIRMLKTNTARSTITRYLLIAPLLLGLVTFFSCQNGMSQNEDISAPVEGAILSEVEQYPVPQDGKTGLYSYMLENMQYPEEAKKAGLEGKVFVEFVVDKEGNVNNVKILRGIGSGCDEEALRVVSNSPKWTPGVQDGKAVNVRMVLPITFSLD